MDGEPSIVEYFAGHEGYRCGYCKSSDSNFSHGMWAHQMHVQDYQDLIDRGWRRSGKYCYKPTLNRTCCPMYTIKCDTLNFKLSKSQKKSIKQVNRFLITGKCESGDKAPGGPIDDEEGMSGEGDVTNTESILADKMRPGPVDPPLKFVNQADKSENNSASEDAIPSPSQEGSQNSDTASSTAQMLVKKKNPPKKGSGADPNKPVCRKAKELRAERRQQKQSAKPDWKNTSKKNAPKTLEELLGEPEQIENSVHKLEIQLCRSSPKSAAFQSSFQQSYSVYRSYQMAIHKDEEDDCDRRNFEGFLVDSPLKELRGEGGPSMGYGSFHQQYTLDGQIIAVGVIDILPTCVSSVYLYYDPSYSFLTLGVYSALREIAFVRGLAQHTPDLHFYYMGFYIHSCPKMRYKGHYSPSFLACPESYNWIPIEKCTPKLEVSNYARFEKEGIEDKDKVTDIGQVLVLHKGSAMQYQTYTTMKKGKNTDQTEVDEYANFVGKVCAGRMLLFRK